jgi:hypothetical protein
MNDITGAECCLRVAGKTGGAVWVCLDLLAPPFASRQKVENKSKKNDSKSKEVNMRYRVRPGMTGRGAKACGRRMVEKSLWGFEKVKTG